MTTTTALNLVPPFVHHPECQSHEYLDNDYCNCDPGVYLFSKYTLRNERYTAGMSTLVQGDRVHGLYDPFEILDTVYDTVTGGMVLHRAWDVYEDATGQRFTVETYNWDDEVA